MRAHQLRAHQSRRLSRWPDRQPDRPAITAPMQLIWQGLLDALGLLASGDPATLRIAALSLAVSGLATALATLIGVPLGALLALGAFRGRRALVFPSCRPAWGCRRWWSGLGVSLLLCWRSGPLGVSR